MVEVKKKDQILLISLLFYLKRNIYGWSRLKPINSIVVRFKKISRSHDSCCITMGFVHMKKPALFHQNVAIASKIL